MTVELSDSTKPGRTEQAQAGGQDQAALDFKAVQVRVGRIADHLHDIALRHGCAVGADDRFPGRRIEHRQFFGKDQFALHIVDQIIEQRGIEPDPGPEGFLEADLEVYQSALRQTGRGPRSRGSPGRPKKVSRIL